ncbi:hypothetical protein PCC9214_02546 [Planktothrix tepida]|uniref:Argininosuccinate lyase n=2 Tax=Planktothrix TaxID=54304 RepID=A0A1J1LLV7_9CYAN|nr:MULTISPECIES: hypothetical protein [Planktothrix]CAD5950858.1 hypothetical protein PCC9214_02546 [Planktothrix tepida]CAD5959894.1 hypothetical protein NO713_03129 [Planktothrix pseudagardhii]CUR32593.1 conserved exported hypothetical protein [Planktothrix tepida PCC 9214]
MFQIPLPSTLPISRLFTAFLVLPLVMFHSQRAIADKSDFVIANNSSKMVTELYLSDSSLDNWEYDILQTDVLPTGQSVQVLFSDPNSARCFYDIRAVFADGQILEDYQINVCRNNLYTFVDPTQT